MDPQTPDQNQVPPAPAPVQADPSVVAKQQIVEAIRGGKNILVTVGENPSVDELASALGFTFLLGKLEKHATAVFSGEIPPAMEFLDPEKTFEDSVDSLRDFIIALDKEKADKLSYKVEDDVVKVRITPYRTIISEKDLTFSQGEVNVDVVIALGVQKSAELDAAITSHGRILHDASVIVINASSQKSDLGMTDWNDETASSVAEMLVSLSSELGPDLLDSQISTAFLTGIVAETNRFSNEKTSPKVMTISAQLMAAGANQQLIATNLRHEGMISEPVRTKEDQAHDDGGEMVLNHPGDNKSKDKGEGQNEDGGSKKEDNSADAQDDQKKVDSKNDDSKEDGEKTEDTDESKSTSDEDYVASLLKTDDNPDNSKDQLKKALDEAAKEAPKEAPKEDKPEEDTPLETEASLLPTFEDTSVPPAPIEVTTPAPEAHHEKVLEPLPVVDSPAALPSLEDVKSEVPQITPMPTPAPMDPPTFGGTLNATSAVAQEDSAVQAEREASVNNISLEHEESKEDQVEAARKAVEDAGAPLPPTPVDIEALPPAPLPSISDTPDTSVSEMQATPLAPINQPVEEPSPIEAFMQPQNNPNALNESFNVGPPPVNQPFPSPATLPNAPAANGLPPLPPMPTTNGGALPPLPPLPGQPVDPAAGFSPQINPSFMQDMPQSANPWTQAGDDLASQQADKDANRQAKMDQMTQQYDTAVDRNREMQGLPPLNDPNGSGFPPIPPAK